MIGFDYSTYDYKNTLVKYRIMLASGVRLSGQDFRKSLGVPNDFLAQITGMVATETKLKYRDEKVSATDTLKAITNESLASAVRLIAEIRSRTLFFNGSSSAKNNIRYCAIVPIFMAAHKEFNNIPYESWDKTDPYIKYIVGIKLYEEIQPYLEYIKEIDGNLLELRKLALNTPKGKEVSATSYPRHSMKLFVDNKPLTWTAYDLARHIKMQTWMANVENRHKFMILDTINWDNIPDSFDEQFEQVNTLSVDEQAVKDAEDFGDNIFF